MNFCHVLRIICLMQNLYNVYLIENEDPSRNSSGGVMSYIINLSKYISSLSSKPVLVAAGPCIEDNVEFTFPFRILRISEKPISNIKYLYRLFLNFWRIPNNSNTIIHCQRPDYLLPFIFFRKNAKLICTMHGMRDFGIVLKKGKIFGKIYIIISGWCLKKSQHVVVVDRKSRDIYLKRYPWLLDKISIIPIGIDINVFKPMNKKLLRNKYRFSSNDHIVIFVGRLELEKNVDFLINVCANLYRKDLELKLLIIGNGSLLNSLKKQVSGLSSDFIYFLGEIENALIAELINIADVLALCSTYEGSPTVVKEALACNVRVVSTDVGDVKEVLTDFEGSQISKKELADFEFALESVLNNSKVPDYQHKIRKYSHLDLAKKTVYLYDILK